MPPSETPLPQERQEQIRVFLTGCGFGGCDLKPVAGDASSRRYHRLDSKTANPMILMDWPAERGGDFTPFATVAELLAQYGSSVPEIHARDDTLGLMLIEDFGDTQFFDIMAQDPQSQLPLYRAAVDLLVDWHHNPAPALEPLGPRQMAEMTSLAFSHYLAATTGDANDAARTRFENRFEDILRATLQGEMVFVHRDFHAQNLMWLPDRTGIGRVGVIDFQDARTGHRSYDLVSLLQDARRDVPAGIEMQMIDRYIQAAGVDEGSFRTAYAVTGVQRNMRILGIFARLSRELGKPQYIDLVPRVWRHFSAGLDHPALAPVADELRQLFCEPDTEVMKRLLP